MTDSDNSNIKISMILPVYNVEKYLDRCMDSILCQTMDHKDFEVILVDDGAKDSSPAICDEYSAKYDNFIVIHQVNGGAAAARNTGLEVARGEYVVFVDPDDYIEADYLETAYNTASRNGADIAVFDAVRENNVVVDGVPAKVYIDAPHAQDDNSKCSMQDNNSNSSAQDSNYGSSSRVGNSISSVKAGNERTSVPFVNDLQRKNNSVQLWNHARSSFTTSDRADIFSMQCQILYPYMAARVGKISFTKDIPLSAPWDKCFRRAFLIEKKLMFPAQLKVLDDMSFNFVAFGEAGKIAYTPKPLYHYCIDHSSITNSYKENRPELDMQVFEYLREKIRGRGVDDANIDTNGISKDEADTGNDAWRRQSVAVESDIMQAYYARIIKSFAICCRLCFFNDKNPRSAGERLEQVKSYMDTDPYNEAFRSIRMKDIDYKLKAVTIAGKMRSSRMLRFLDRLQNK